MKFSHSIDPESFFIRALSSCPESYWQSTKRGDYFEVICFRYADAIQEGMESNPQTYVQLIPIYRTAVVNTNDKTGYLMAFKRAYLEEDDKEYALDVFKLFNDEGDYATLLPDDEVVSRLKRTTSLIEEECDNPLGSYLVLKALIKVYLLNLIRMQQKAFLSQDVNQKRVYQFILLLNEHYLEERKTSFYAGKIGISEKRLNQILLEKMNKTATQQLHNRLIWEAKRLLMASEFTIKEIAWHLNFEDRGYFTRFFKKQTKQTPEEFRDGATSL